MNWNDVLTLAKHNPAPPNRVEKTDSEWKKQLTPEQYRVTRQHGTEMAFTGEYCEMHSPGIYACVCCGTPLFDSRVKFESGTGWPSFTEPIRDRVIRYVMDHSWGMVRVEVLCNICDAHLGHVFPDGPKPSGLRFCINSAALQKLDESDASTGSSNAGQSTASEPIEKATVGGGCFWCIEAILEQLEGVTSVESGYAGGTTENPGYDAVCSGRTGHAEVVQVSFKPSLISYADLLRVFMTMHNPTTLNRQGADVGTQYRSIILYHNDQQKQEAEAILAEIQGQLDKPVVTEIKPLEHFYPAEDYHQRYYSSNPRKAYCQAVIDPKLIKLRMQYASRLKKEAV